MMLISLALDPSTEAYYRDLIRTQTCTPNSSIQIHGTLEKTIIASFIMRDLKAYREYLAYCENEPERK